MEQIPNSWISITVVIPDVIPVLVDEKPQTVVLHTGSNYITKFNNHDVEVDDLVNRILQIGLKRRYYGVDSIALFCLFF